MSMGFNTTIPHGLPTFGRTSTAKWLFILSLLASPTFAPSAFAADSEAGTAAQARQSVIKGVVVDQNGEPVPGAAVVVDGTTTGTVTDFDGNFSISVAAGTQLNFSFIGYTSVSAPAANGMKVVLEDDSQQIEEIAVVAYGAQKKVTVTGAISSVKSEELMRTPVSSVNNVLAGQLSGVTTVQTSGEPGADAASIFVRGKASFAGDDAVKPLIQVDGVERDMWDLDPNEIESVTVLKDASATAVFGVRGANGVILVTTKRGQEGKANINVSTAFSALMPTKMVEMTNAYDYAKFYNQMMANDGSAPIFSDYVIERFQKNDNPLFFPSIDWADYVMKDVALQTQSNVSIDGGTDKVKYFVSVGLFTQGGLFEEFDLPYHFDYRYKRLNYRSNIDIDVAKYSKLGISVSGKVDRKYQPITSQGASGLIKEIYHSSPFMSPRYNNGVITNLSTSIDDYKYTPYYYIDANGKQHELSESQITDLDKKVAVGEVAGHYNGQDVYVGDDVQMESVPAGFAGSASTYITYHPGNYIFDSNKLSMDLQFEQGFDFVDALKGLTFKIKGSYNSDLNSRKGSSGGSFEAYTPVYRSGGVVNRLDSEPKMPINDKPSPGKGRNWYFESSLNYHRSFDRHNVGLLALYNQSKSYYFSGSGDKYHLVPRTYVGLVARASYDFANKYMAEFNFGYNGSENFAPGKRFGKFPAGSIGWAISEEGFFDDLKPAVTFLKLRASWGSVGNDKVRGARFMYTADPVNPRDTNTAVDHEGYSYMMGSAVVYTSQPAPAHGAAPSQKQINNADVSWEKAFKQDYGIDVNFLDNRLSTSFDYYYEKRTDILAQDGTAPKILGFDQPYTNFGRVNSWGWEASIGWNSSINEDWRIWAKFNISHNENEIVEDRQTPQVNEFQYTKGRRIGARYQYKFWKLSEGYEIDNQKYRAEFGRDLPSYTNFVNVVKPGDMLYVDLDGNGVVDDNDQTRDLGYTDDPKYVAGLNLGASWKNWSFSMQWAGAWQVSRVISDVFRRPFVDSSSTNKGGLLQYHIDNTWTPENPDLNAKYPRATITNAALNYSPNSDFYEQDSKYFRLKTAEIAYNFDFPFMKTIGLRRMQMSLNGYNLLTFSPYLWGDPEARASNAPSYPLQRTYTASLKLSF